MSGIDEVRMESCRACIDHSMKHGLNLDAILNRQYWTIRGQHGDVLGYYNPDEFRASRGEREDKVNPKSGTRKQIVENPGWFVGSIHHFRCESCDDRVGVEHPEFEIMKSFVYEFVSGDVFPRLNR